MATEKIYRYRAWNVNVWYGARHGEEITPEQIDAGWEDWIICDEKKYKEICEYIEWPSPSHYQAQALDVEVAENKSFNPAAYIEHAKAKRAIAGQQKVRRISLHRTFDGKEWSPWFVSTNGTITTMKSDEKVAQIEYAAALETQGTYGSLKIGNALYTTFTFYDPEHERAL